MKLFTIIIILFSFNVFAGSAERIAYQGRLLQATGAPLVGPVDLTFKLYKNADTTVQCVESLSAVSLSQGIFGVELTFPLACNGGKTFKEFLQDSATAGDMVYIEVTDDTNSKTYDKQAFSAASYAMIAMDLGGQSRQQLVPSGAVMAFDLAACPSGWSELTSARGRYLVGMPSGGTLNATAGTALTDQENRPTGIHGHTASSGNQSANHTHNVNPAAVSSGLESASHTHAVTGGSHQHAQGGIAQNAGTGKIYAPWGSYASPNSEEASTNGIEGGEILPYTSPTAHTHTVGTQSANHSHIVDVGNTTSTINSASHNHAITVANSSGVAGTNAPYIQLLICRKN